MVLIYLISTRVPFANGPSEWQWPYRPFGLGGIQTGLGLILAAALMIPLVHWMAHDRPTDWRWALPLLMLLGWAVPLLLARAQPGGFQRVFDALASRHTFGYVFDAGLAPDSRALLADWPAASAGLNQHSRTHPPGPLLAVRALDLLGRRLPPDPKGERGLMSSAAESLRREVGRVAHRNRPRDRPLVRKTLSGFPAPGTLVLLAFLLPLASALTAWPLHRLALGLGLAPGAALLAAALWLTVPARSVFTPSLDQALPLLAVTAAWLAVSGSSDSGRWRTVLAGGLLALAVFFSYGYLAVAPLVGLLALTARPASWRSSWKSATLLAAGFLLPWIALALFAGYDPWASFRTAVEQHREIAVASRSYGTWLAWNLYDFQLLLGPAVLALAALSLAGREEEGWSPAHAALAWGWWALLLVLAVSGSVRGEVGRIWLFLMPFACILAAGEAVRRWGPRSPWTALVLVLELALLMILAGNLVFVG